MKIRSFFLGLLTAIFALVLEAVFSMVTKENLDVAFYTQIGKLLVVAVLIEEILKYILIRQNIINLALKKRAGLISSSLFFGLGFVTVEIILHISGKTIAINSLLLPALGILLIHTLTCFLIGLTISPGRILSLLSFRILVFNIFLHLSYNIAIIYFT